MESHDYRVSPLTIEQIENQALFIRKKCEISGKRAWLDVYDLLFGNPPPYLDQLGLKLICRPAGFMGGKEAYATSKPKRIFYRQRLFAQLRLGDQRAAIVFLHEFAHVLLHPGAPKAWLTGGNNKIAYIEEDRSAERQATMFALCFKAPTHLSNDCHTAEDLMQKFGLCVADAEVRIAEILLRRPRKLRRKTITEIDGKLMTSSNSNTPYEPCPDCGSPLNISPTQKQLCYACRRFGDKFQDGDRIGYDL